MRKARSCERALGWGWSSLLSCRSLRTIESVHGYRRRIAASTSETRYMDRMPGRAAIGRRWPRETQERMVLEETPAITAASRPVTIAARSCDRSRSRGGDGQSLSVAGVVTNLDVCSRANRSSERSYSLARPRTPTERRCPRTTHCRMVAGERRTSSAASSTVSCSAARHHRSWNSQDCSRTRSSVTVQQLPESAGRR
jgi:hypothetical protein